MLAWLVFGIAAAYGYLLAEAEPNMGDGNWLWSGQVALFVLFAESVLFLRSRGAPRLVADRAMAPGLCRGLRAARSPAGSSGTEPRSSSRTTGGSRFPRRLSLPGSGLSP